MEVFTELDALKISEIPVVQKIASFTYRYSLTRESSSLVQIYFMDSKALSSYFVKFTCSLFYFFFLIFVAQTLLLCEVSVRKLCNT